MKDFKFDEIVLFKTDTADIAEGTIVGLNEFSAIIKTFYDKIYPFRPWRNEFAKPILIRRHVVDIWHVNKRSSE